MGGCSSGFRNRFPFHRVPDMIGDGIRSGSSLFLSLSFYFCFLNLDWGLGTEMIAVRIGIFLNNAEFLICRSFVLLSVLCFLNEVLCYVTISDQTCFS